MAFADRLALIRQIETIRGSRVICYLTSLRPNVLAAMEEDAAREIFDHLSTVQPPPIGKLDLFLCSNGGDGTLPWRLVPVLRQYTKHFAVLVPYHAYSAATILALGANEVVMHPFGVLGPIDPTVANEFNPQIPPGSGRYVGISVEDVKAYISFVKETIGIKHEDELVRRASCGDPGSIFAVQRCDVGGAAHADRHDDGDRRRCGLRLHGLL